MRNTILHGDALSVLKSLPDNHVQCAITSPPYYNLRSYLPDDHPEKSLEIGLEETSQHYVEKLVQVFHEARRVLRPDGILWLNIGDTYAGSGKGGQSEKILSDNWQPVYPRIKAEFASKQLMMIPARVAIALQSDGWWLRSSCIWHKPNAMPSSVTDRPTNDYEYVFLLSKSEHYFYDAEAIKEPAHDWGTRDRSNGKYTAGQPPIMNNAHHGLNNANFSSIGRNKRSVWSIPTTPFPHSHFAVMPPELVETCLLSGSSPKACEHCDAPWQRIIDHSPMVIRNGPKSGGYGSRTTDGLSGTMLAPSETRTIGWKPTCKCENNTGSGKCIVLDPFAGAGTVPLVAIRHGRDWLGIELNFEYITLINKRIETVQPNLWTEVDGGSVA
jgi:DNA modification methylase